MRSTLVLSAATTLLASQMVGALDLNVNDQKSIKDAAKTIAKDVMSYYTGNKDSSVLGRLPMPYYWWEAGGMFGNMVNYAAQTGDTQYNDDVAKGLYSQVAPTKDFVMMDIAGQLGSDDQAFWGLSAMDAAESGLNPPSGAPSDIWLTAAENTFNDLIGRWNTSFCGGGIKWQFIEANNGFLYKSSIVNAATMQLGARLAVHTKNQTYADKATQIYDWMANVGYISDNFQVYDGAGDDPDNCTKIDFHEWSYNSGAMIGATAAMANYSATNGKSDAQTWIDRANGLWQHATENFFKDGVIYEQACEGVDTCNADQKSFKSYLAKWSVMAGKFVPSMMSDVQSKLQSTANAMAKSCTGNGAAACGSKWYGNAYSGATGLGEEMSAMEVVVGLLSAGSGGSNSNNKASSPSSASSAQSSAASTAAAESSAAGSSAASPPASTAAVAQAALTSAAAAAISAGAKPDAVSQALAAYASGAPVSALNDAIHAMETGVSNSAAITSILGDLIADVKTGSAPNMAVPTTIAPAAISSAAEAAISAGAKPAAVSEVLAAYASAASNPEAVNSAILALESGASNPAAVQTIVAGLVGPSANESCAPVIVTVTSTSVTHTTAPASTTPVATSKAATTPVATVKTSAAPAPSAGVYGGSTGNSTRPSAPVNSIALSNDASGLKMAGLAVLALPAVIVALF